MLEVDLAGYALCGQVGVHTCMWKKKQRGSMESKHVSNEAAVHAVVHVLVNTEQVDATRAVFGK